MTNRRGDIKICVISIWFGRLPSYLPHFLKTCAANSFIDWLFISDQKLPTVSSENIMVMELTQISFTDLASRQLGFKVTIKDPYKVCDFKPLFGKIFEDHLNPYQYWGYCDQDIVFGDIHKHIQPLILEKPDVISFYRNFLSGPFCLFRNTSPIVNLFSHVPGHKSILQDPEHKAFDENIPGNLNGTGLLIYRLSYFLKVIFAGPRYRFRPQEIRYQFQWYAKKLNSRRSSPSDMTDIVHKASRARQIKVVFRDLIRSDRAFKRQGQNHWKLSWMDGILTDTRNEKEIFAFHFVDSKTNPGFTAEPMLGHTEKFTITDRGIEC